MTVMRCRAFLVLQILEEVTQGGKGTVYKGLFLLPGHNVLVTLTSLYATVTEHPKCSVPDPGPINRYMLHGGV